jgi:sarcosine oxidase subunit gamma
MNATIIGLPPSVLARSAAASVTLAAPCARFSLRARGDLGPLCAALGLTLPDRIGRRASAGVVQAICLGPDEWTVHASIEAAAGIAAACAAVSTALPHSLVDVSGRETTFQIDGPRAAELLTLGCPRDIDSIAIGDGRRTNFDGVTVVLWRDGETRFRMDCWNSFASHLFHLLETGCRELAAESV